MIAMVNRLSDYLFAAAKWEMSQQGWSEEVWQAFSYKKRKQ